MKTILILLSLLLIIFGILHLTFSCIVGKVDTGSVTMVLSADSMDPEILAKFEYTPWMTPSAKIRPFVYGKKSFADCKIIRYRRGSRPHWFIWRTYYEAEYLLPAGSKVIGPAFGPLPYSAPNLLVSVPVLSAGIILLIIGLKMKANIKQSNLKC
jgi:hypothetical protein